VFTLPGVGRMLITDVGNRDLVKVQGEGVVDRRRRCWSSGS